MVYLSNSIKKNWMPYHINEETLRYGWQVICEETLGDIDG